MILAIHHAQITIPEGEESAARKFYCGVLELREIPKPVELAGRGGFWLEVGDRQVHVGVEKISENRSTKAHVAYLVDDLEAARERLTAASVDMIDGIQIPGYRRLEFRDPFGNRIEFLQVI
jgi:catechol 2,3-dioxygenase-like lactoylglutathione lyase family enzyme